VVQRMLGCSRIHRLHWGITVATLQCEIHTHTNCGVLIPRRLRETARVRTTSMNSRGIRLAPPPANAVGVSGFLSPFIGPAVAAKREQST
jgi:hypothetical protein